MYKMYEHTQTKQETNPLAIYYVANGKCHDN